MVLQVPFYGKVSISCVEGKPSGTGQFQKFCNRHNTTRLRIRSGEKSTCSGPKPSFPWRNGPSLCEPRSEALKPIGGGRLESLLATAVSDPGISMTKPTDVLASDSRRLVLSVLSCKANGFR